MRQIYNSLLIRGVLPAAALSIATGCVDDKYDLTDIDTTSRFTVDNLTIPVNLETISLDDVVNLDDNENISKIIIDGKEVYAIKKAGNINSDEISINDIHVDAPTIPSTSVGLELPSIISEGTVPPFDVAIPLSTEEEYTIEMNDLDTSLITLNDVKTAQPINVALELSIPGNIMSHGINMASYKNLCVRLPWGLYTDDANYDRNTGLYHINELEIGADGKSTVTFQAYGLGLMDKGTISDSRLEIKGKVGIQSGSIHFNLNDTNVPSLFDLTANYRVSAFDIASFSGNIDYRMDNIDIAPISLSALPDFLNNPETEIRIANPSITILINNPVGTYGLRGGGVISLTSRFSGGNTTEARSDRFSIDRDGAKISFGSPTDGFPEFVDFHNLGNILANSNSGGLPDEITVRLEDMGFSGSVVDFPIGTGLGSANGDYGFTAPLGFGNPSRIVYETTEDGWGGDDLDDLYINRLKIRAVCTTNVPLGIELNVTPVDKNGNLIPVKEPKNLKVSPNCKDEEVYIEITGADGPIRDLDGVRFRAIITQDNDNNTQPIGPDLQIRLSNVRANVDGYFETDF